MLVILPIQRPSYRNELEHDASLRFVLEYFPGGYSTLAYLALIHNKNITDFVNEACILLIDTCEQFEDESLAQFAYDRAAAFCSSEEFNEWLEDFYRKQMELHEGILAKDDLAECSHAIVHPTKLIIRI